MKITDKRRRVLVDLSDGEWSDLHHHSSNVKAALHRAKLIRCDDASALGGVFSSHSAVGSTCAADNAAPIPPTDGRGDQLPPSTIHTGYWP